MNAQPLTGPEKAAVLLLSLGPEVATEVMRHLAEDEVRKVVQAVARVRSVDADRLEVVNREFAESLGQNPSLAVDGREFAMTLLSRAAAAQQERGKSREAVVLADIEQSVMEDVGLAQALEGVPAAGLASLLESEHPQIAALILAHLDPVRASETIASLPEELQVDVVERMARIDTVPSGLHGEVGAVLASHLRGLVRPPGSQVGGVRAVAEVVNQLGGDAEGKILGAIEERDAELGQRIRALTFTFDDCVKLDARSLQTLLKEVPREDLLYGLKTASPALSEKIFANVSSRAAEILREDMSSLGPVRLSDVEAAQQRIIATLRELQADGKIAVAGGGGDVLV
ncbi:MAG: flagellar motor switch protein FliG [Thermodesulfobacteriota bacterium]